jgi:hypothetical protein
MDDDRNAWNNAPACVLGTVWGQAVALCTIKRRINDQSSLMPPGKRQTRRVLKQLIAKAATNLHSHGHCRDPSDAT